jgi:hypothetical protein
VNPVYKIDSTVYVVDSIPVPNVTKIFSGELNVNHAYVVDFCPVTNVTKIFSGELNLNTAYYLDVSAVCNHAM